MGEKGRAMYEMRGTCYLSLSSVSPDAFAAPSPLSVVSFNLSGGSPDVRWFNADVDHGVLAELYFVPHDSPMHGPRHAIVAERGTNGTRILCCGVLQLILITQSPFRPREFGLQRSSPDLHPRLPQQTPRTML
jgi:hypothetical protein